MVYKKRLIDHHTWLPQLDSNQRSGFGHCPRSLWLPTTHCVVGFTRRALCAVLLCKILRRLVGS